MRKAAENREWRAAVGGVEPLAGVRRRELPRAKPEPLPRQRQADERAALAESLGPFSVDDALDSGEELVFLRQGLSRQVLRKLRKGHWVVEESLDLHGMNRRDAAAGVAEFLRECAARGRRCVRIVHGKGRGSRNREPVLKGKLRKWLPPRDDVLAFCQAPAAHGGGGALLVLLKPAR
jgi:DNA-nicking Smr family endonuclease